MPRHFNHLLILFFSSFLFSCNNNDDETIAVFRSLDETMMASNQTILRSTEMVDASFRSKLAEPSGYEKASMYYPKVKAIRQLTSTVVDSIEKLKNLLKINAGIKVDDTNTSAWGDKRSVTRLFSNDGKGVELKRLLLRYQSDVLAVDSSLSKEFGNNLFFPGPALDENSRRQFKNLLSGHIPVAGALALLTKFQNNIYSIENKTVLYQHGRFAYHPVRHEENYAAIISQNSSCVSPGQQIEITAGVGVMTQSIRLVVTMNGDTIPADASAVAIAKFRAPSKPGNYKVPVKLDFIGMDGRSVTITKNIAYTVFNKDSTAQ